MRSRTSSSRRGSALIEFAIVLMPLLAIIFGAIEMDRMLLVHTSIANAAKAGVRYAIVHGLHNPGNANVATMVRQMARTGLVLDTSKVDVVVKWTDPANTDLGTTAPMPVGTRVSVSVSYPYDPLTSLFPAQVTVRSTSKGVVAF